jgi:hypothetical protein
MMNFAFVRDRFAGETTRVSVSSSTGAERDGSAGGAVLSADRALRRLQFRRVKSVTAQRGRLGQRSGMSPEDTK